MLNNIKKTIAYVKRNGVPSTVVAAAERIRDQRADNYEFVPASEENLEKQRRWYRSLLNDPAKSKKLPYISILVPCYSTNRAFLRKMIESVRDQTYGKWELILAEAPVIKEKDGKKVKLYPLAKTIAGFSSGDGRIKYLRLKENAGISGNTNSALDTARGDYIALLDHDDVLTPDALCEVAIMAIRNYPRLIFSDEDKCDAEDRKFFQGHRKPAFNADMFLSNNYICHFTVLRSDVIFKNRFRADYDGAQDYDLFLRAAGEVMFDPSKAKQIVHIPKVLYHWRTHDESTAANPQSKSYAYEAGRRAVQEFLKENGIEADVSHLKHVGFYRVDYRGDIFECRKDIGVVGGRVVDKRGTIIGGNYRENGKVRFENLPRGYSGGFFHHAALQQDADAVDPRCMRIRPELIPIYEEVFGFKYVETLFGNSLESIIPYEETELREKAILFGQRVKHKGYRILWDPIYEKTV